MAEKRRTRKPSRKVKPLSLYPLSTEEALKAALQTPSTLLCPAYKIGKYRLSS